MKYLPSASQITLLPVGGGMASRLCRRTRRATLASATVFALTSQIPGMFLIDEEIAHLVKAPVLSLVNGVAFSAIVLFGCLYFISLVTMQGAVQRQFRLLLKQDGSLSRTYLYLRSFSLTNSSILDRVPKIFDPRLLTLSPFSRAAYKLHDPEEEIAEAVASVGLLVAIGDKRRSYGAAKLHTSDEEWQSEFLRLADGAEIIFVFPAFTEGSKWELEQLVQRRDYLGKTIFFMPRNWYSDEWNDLREKSKTFLSIELPEYDSRGAYFVIDTASQLRWFAQPETFIHALTKKPMLATLRESLMSHGLSA